MWTLKLWLVMIGLTWSLSAGEPEAAMVNNDLYTVGDLREYAKLVDLQDQFNRELGGCPSRGTKGECIPGAGVLDLKLWSDICRQAQKVFTSPKHGRPGKQSRVEEKAAPGTIPGIPHPPPLEGVGARRSSAPAL